jgi:hypothetical protein
MVSGDAGTITSRAGTDHAMAKLVRMVAAWAMTQRESGRRSSPWTMTPALYDE